LSYVCTRGEGEQMEGAGCSCVYD